VNIYVASSWRNEHQPEVVRILREFGHEVYDFRNPPGGTGFSWRQVSGAYVPGAPVSGELEIEMIEHPIAAAGYASDIGALNAADALVYVLPCGRSASWEFGYAMAQGKECFVLWIGDHEPELMFRDAVILSGFEELRGVAEELADE